LEPILLVSELGAASCQNDANDDSLNAPQSAPNTINTHEYDWCQDGRFWDLPKDVYTIGWFVV
jgi:hypothetical protein